MATDGQLDFRRGPLLTQTPATPPRGGGGGGYGGFGMKGASVAPAPIEPASLGAVAQPVCSPSASGVSDVTSPPSSIQYTHVADDDSAARWAHFEDSDDCSHRHGSPPFEPAGDGASVTEPEVGGGGGGGCPEPPAAAASDAASDVEQLIGNDDQSDLEEEEAGERPADESNGNDHTDAPPADEEGDSHSLAMQGAADPYQITPAQRDYYTKYFVHLMKKTQGGGGGGGNLSGALNGADPPVRDFFRKSQLSEPALHQVWRLADANADGWLNYDEFVAAMHLCVVHVKAQLPLPDYLPAHFAPPLTPSRDAGEAGAAAAPSSSSSSSSSSSGGRAAAANVFDSPDGPGPPQPATLAQSGVPPVVRKSGEPASPEMFCADPQLRSFVAAPPSAAEKPVPVKFAAGVPRAALRSDDAGLNRSFAGSTAAAGWLRLHFGNWIGRSPVSLG